MSNIDTTVSFEVAKSKEIVKSFILYAFGAFFVFSAYMFTLNLQSSINIEGGLGTKALACSYFTSTFFGLISAPILLQRLGPKKCMLLSEAAYMLFVASNYYPTYYTMIPAAVVVGFAESMMWPCISLMNVYYGTEYWKTKSADGKSLDYYVNLFSGYYFSIHHLCHIFGSVVGFLILNVFAKDSAPEIFVNATTNDTTASPAWNMNVSIDPFQYCGSRDCQNGDTVEENIENYVPANRLQLTILITCFVLMCLLPAILHAFILPDFRQEKRNVETLRRKPQKSEEIKKSQEIRQREDSQAALLKSADKIHCTNSDLRKYSSVDEDCELDIKSDAPADSAQGPGCCTVIFDTLKDVCKQLSRPKQLLIIPITFYQGMLMTFVFSELSRAYVSCVNGVASISLYLCLYGVGHISASLVVGRIGKVLGRTITLFLVMCLDAGNLLFCLLWTPNPQTSWMIFISYLAFGVADGTWQPSINVAHMEFFPDRRHVAGSVWTATFSLGFGSAFAWSTAFCVYEKIYIMYGVLGLGFALFCIAERIHKRETGGDLDSKSKKRKTAEI